MQIKKHHAVRVVLFALGLVLTLAASFGLSARAEAQTTHTVQSGESIQAAIDGASSGDTILVEPGTYLDRIRFGGKDLILTSTDGPEVTILAGEPNQNVEMGPLGMLSGFTISHSYNLNPGVEVLGAGSVVTGNIFTNNVGYGIVGSGASPIISGNTFYGNSCESSFGVAVVALLNDGSATITNNVFSDNDCVAVALLPTGDAAPYVANNTFVGNSEAVHINSFVDRGVVALENNLITANGIGVRVATSRGSGAPTMSHNNLFDNRVDYRGTAAQTGTDGNVAVDPMISTVAGSTHPLLAGSPMIDAGDPATTGLPPTDFLGDARILGAAVDIGADEFDPATAPNCSSDTTVGTLGELNMAISCFNQQTPAGNHTIALSNFIFPVGLPVAPITQADPDVELFIDGAGLGIEGNLLIDQALITVTGDGTVVLNNMLIKNLSDDPINLLMNGGVVRVFDSAVSSAHMRVTSGDLSLIRTIVHSVEDSDALRQSDGDVFLFGSIIAGNRGGIRTTGGSLRVFFTSFIDNRIAIENRSTTGGLVISGSEFSANRTGVLQSGNPGDATDSRIANTTFWQNTTTAVEVRSGELAISNASLFLNETGILAPGGNVEVNSSILVNADRNNFIADCRQDSFTPVEVAGESNFSLGTECGPGFTPFESADFAFFGVFDDHGCAPTSQTPAGCTRTVSILPGHPAVGAGKCTGLPVSATETDDIRTDQRQFARRSPCDAGAFETDSAPIIAFLGQEADAELCNGDAVDWVGPGSGRYQLRIGTTPDGTDVLSKQTTATELRVGELPAGQELFLSLRHQPDGGSWTLHDQTSFLPCSPPPIPILEPAAGAELCTGDTIVWDSADGGRYQLRIGTTPDGNDVLSKQTTATQLTMSELPAGTDLFVSLRHRPEGGSWSLQDEVAYAACTASPIEITTPDLGTELCLGDTIQWAGPDSGRYQLRIGTTSDGNDVLSKQTTATQLTMSELPAGTGLFVSLRHRPEGGSWILHDQATYAACTGIPVEITTPAPGGELCQGDVMRWEGPDSGRYRLRLGTHRDLDNIVSHATSSREFVIRHGLGSTAVFASLRHQPEAGAPWILRDEAWFSRCTATPITIVEPVLNADLCPGDIVRWEAADSGRYRLRIGTTPDGTDVLNQATSATEFTVETVPLVPDLFITLRHQAEAGAPWILFDEISVVGCAEPTIDITSPLEGDPLCAGDLIAWEGPDTGRFRLRIGTAPDGTDVLNQPAGHLGLTVGELPVGVDLYVSLRYRPEGMQSWILQDVIAVTACPA